MAPDKLVVVLGRPSSMGSLMLATNALNETVVVCNQVEGTLSLEELQELIREEMDDRKVTLRAPEPIPALEVPEKGFVEPVEPSMKNKPFQNAPDWRDRKGRGRYR